MSLISLMNQLNVVWELSLHAILSYIWASLTIMDFPSALLDFSLIVCKPRPTL